MSRTEEEKKLYNELIKTVKVLRESSPTLNNEVTKISNTLQEVQKQQSQLGTDMAVMIAQSTQVETKMDKLHDAVYDPKEGLLKRISDISASDVRQVEQLTKLINDVDEQEDEINTLSIDNINLKKIAGERLENLDDTVKTNKNFKKLVWIGVAGLVAVLAKEFGPAIIGLLIVL